VYSVELGGIDGNGLVLINSFNLSLIICMSGCETDMYYIVLCRERYWYSIVQYLCVEQTVVEMTSTMTIDY
jgi:hypothetical protein